jgi:hypothetical protein
MSAANLTVTISGDASGLVGAVSEAQASIAALESSASALSGLDGTSIAIDITAEDNATAVVSAAEASISALNGLEAKGTITAVDNTAAGVASAQAAINSIQDRTVTITVNYQTTGSVPKLARGTDNAPDGLAMVNDERGISDPRELIYHDGQYMMFSGRDVVLPLSKGDKVYTASQTKKILSGIPHYAAGKDNDEDILELIGTLSKFGLDSVNVEKSTPKNVHTNAEILYAWKNGGSMVGSPNSETYEEAEDEWKHYKKTNAVTTTEELQKWIELAKTFNVTEADISDIEENIFSLAVKISDELNEQSKTYIEERTALNDWDDYGDSAIAAFERVRARNEQDYKDGLITWDEYVDNVSDIGEDMYEDRLKQSKSWLKQESEYNNLSAEDYIAGLERMKTYTEEYYENGIISYREYSENMRELSNAITDKEDEIHNSVYQKWLSDAENWKKLRDTYDDWEEYGDSEVQYYERCIERIGELYNDGHISWQEYMDETMNYSMDLYNAQMSEIDSLMDAQAEYISQLKTEFSDKESELKASWEVEDRADDIADVKEQLAIYQNAVTEKGKSKYSDLQDKLKSLEREEELYQLQKSDNAIIAELETEYSAMEKDKKALLASIQSSGIDVQGLIRGINSETSGIQDVMSSLAAKIISAINSKSTYSDNRSIQISAADSSTLKQFTKSVEETIARGRYY